MAQGIGMAIACALVVMLATICSAEDHDLGAWNLKRTREEYKKFAVSTTFTPGDTLKFEFAEGVHNVYKLATQEAYDNCDLSNPLKTYSQANAVINLNTPGKNFFVCGVGTHCSQGMKVTINVAGEGPSPAPAPGAASTFSASFFFSTVVCLGAVAALLKLF